MNNDVTKILAELLSKMGDCPLENFDYELDRCTTDCQSNKDGECWIKYAEDLAKESEQ